MTKFKQGLHALVIYLVFVGLSAVLTALVTDFEPSIFSKITLLVGCVVAFLLGFTHKGEE